MMHLPCGLIFAVLHLHTYGLVSVAVGHTGESEPVDILHCEEIVVFGVADNVAVHADMLKHEVAHLQTTYDFGCGRECDIFEQL